MKYAKGIFWLDDCRIPFIEKDTTTYRKPGDNKSHIGIMADRPNIKFVGSMNDDYKKGRFTPNLLVCDDMLNDGSVSKGKVNMRQQASPNKVYGEFHSKGNTKINDGISDKGTNSRYYDLDKWFNKLIDEI